MLSKKQQDLNLGFNNEKLIFNKLRSLPYCDDLELISGFSIIDGKGKYAELELKTRRNINHNQYPTGIIGVNKINEFKKNGKDHNYVVWKYDDGLFYLKHDDATFSKFVKDIQRVWRDGKCELSECYYVPYEYMNKLE